MSIRPKRCRASATMRSHSRGLAQIGNKRPDLPGNTGARAPRPRSRRYRTRCARPRRPDARRAPAPTPSPARDRAIRRSPAPLCPSCFLPCVPPLSGLPASGGAMFRRMPACRPSRSSLEPLLDQKAGVVAEQTAGPDAARQQLPVGRSAIRGCTVHSPDSNLQQICSEQPIEIFCNPIDNTSFQPQVSRHSGPCSQNADPRR